MLELQIRVLAAWLSAGDHVRRRHPHERDRGEVTATTVIIVILVIAAIAAGGVIASKITENANNVPSP
jgi:heme A synthase